MQVIERRISFNGGEWSPWADARLDLDRYRSSCRTMENFRPTTYGGAFSRAGLIYLADQDNPGSIGRVVPFEFSATTNLVLVFTDELMRPFTTGENPENPQVDIPESWDAATDYEVGDYVEQASSIWYCLEAHTSSALFSTDQGAGKWELQEYFKMPTPYTADELADLQFAQLNDLIYITHPDHAPRVLSRHANNWWTLEVMDLEYPPLRDENIETTTITPSSTTGTPTLQASADIFDAGHVGSRWLIKHRREEPFKELAVNTGVGNATTGLMVLGEWSCSIMAGDGTGNWDVTAVVQRSTDNSTWETIRTITASRQDQSALITGTELDPCWLRVRKKSESGTPPANGNWKLEAVDPDHYGLVEITGYTDANTVTANVLFTLGGTTATKRWAEGAWSDYRGWPRSVCIHDQRLLFGGNSAQPQHIWASIIDDFGNFRTGAEDDLGLVLYNANQKSNAVQWLVSAGDLLIGTSGSEGPLERLDTSKAIGPTNIKFGRFTQTGSKHMQALAAHDAVLFISRNGRKVWEQAFAFESDGYKANDLTLLAEHIADEEIIAVALQKNPETILWCVTDDGRMLGLLYERAQEVAGWFRYVTAGSFESVAVVPGTGEQDEVWVTVRREIGEETVRYLERFQPDRMNYLKAADGEGMLESQSFVCCADSAVIREMEPALGVVTGLGRLEGMEVCVVADGAPLANRTVTGGQITLDQDTSVAIIGLPFTCTLSPTYFETGDPGSVSKVAWKCISKVCIHLWRSLGCDVGTSASETWESVRFTPQGATMDQALPLFTGIKETRVSSSSENQAAVILRQTQPLPLNVLAIHVFHEMNGVS